MSSLRPRPRDPQPRSKKSWRRRVQQRSPHQYRQLWPMLQKKISFLLRRTPRSSHLQRTQPLHKKFRTRRNRHLALPRPQQMRTATWKWTTTRRLPNGVGRKATTRTTTATRTNKSLRRCKPGAASAVCAPPPVLMGQRRLPPPRPKGLHSWDQPRSRHRPQSKPNPQSSPRDQKVCNLSAQHRETQQTATMRQKWQHEAKQQNTSRRRTDGLASAPASSKQRMCRTLG
mmetsp:Transcript_27289/g.62945  ORF Transcript_27289/g.62945 Transcript_27289/m.62945 type:complete len:229 (+) Transcript_27289:949-1635(+)